jgi:hypothetical protein
MKFTNLLRITFFISLYNFLCIMCNDEKKIDRGDKIKHNEVEVIEEEKNIKKNVNKKYKLKSNVMIEKIQKGPEENFLDIENEMKFTVKSNTQDDSLMYISSFVFIPLVVLIFVMTIVSIIGFFILLLNSNNSNNNTSTIRTQALSFRNNLNNNEILEILQFKKYLKKKQKSEKNCNYQTEPEPEGIFLKN